MKKVLSVVLVAMVLLGAIALPATANKKKKKKKKPKAVATVLYMHGYSQSGEVDGADWLANSAPPMPMSPEEPEESQPKSMFFNNPLLNDRCAGLPLGFPTWVGDLEGTIRGDAVLTVHSFGTGSALARIWTDTPVFSCNEGYIEPAQEIEFDLPSGPGETEIVFEKLNLKANLNIMIEVLAQNIDYPTSAGRVLYDSADYPTRLEFKCIPAKGKSCTP